eukprot:12906705-Prorocentrum_lima.AAC.1
MIQPVDVATLVLDLAQQRCRGQGPNHVLWAVDACRTKAMNISSFFSCSSIACCGEGGGGDT